MFAHNDSKHKTGFCAQCSWLGNVRLSVCELCVMCGLCMDKRVT